MAVVVADTSPLHYLVLVDEAEVLSALYGKVLIPQAVAEELLKPKTPELVRNWLMAAPAWVEIVRPRSGGIPEPALANLGQGERQAILLALDRHADLLLMDDRDGADQARRLGLAVTGTLGVLDRAASRNLIDLSSVVVRLRATNFRVSPEVLQTLLERHGQKD